MRATMTPSRHGGRRRRPPGFHRRARHPSPVVAAPVPATRWYSDPASPDPEPVHVAALAPESAPSWEELDHDDLVPESAVALALDDLLSRVRIVLYGARFAAGHLIASLQR